MRDEMAYLPYRVVIVTLDQHTAGPAARVADSLAQDYPGLTVSVHAAAEWGENPKALEATKKAVAKGDIIIANMLFLEEHVQAIHADLQVRRDQCDALVGMIADADIVKLTKLGDLDMSKPSSGVMSLLKKLRGKSNSGAGSGAKQLKTLRRLPKF